MEGPGQIQAQTSTIKLRYKLTYPQAFKFIKGDVISVVVDMTLKKVTFKKKSESFEIPFQTIPGDELHPCALYYYMND